MIPPNVVRGLTSQRAGRPQYPPHFCIVEPIQRLRGLRCGAWDAESVYSVLIMKARARDRFKGDSSGEM